MTHINIRQANEEHPFAQYVRILGKGKKGSRALTREEAFSAMSMIMKGEVEDVQLGAFMMLMRVKEETNDELTGFAEAVRETLNTPPDIEADLDWSSYAGKRRHLPWYIFSILLLAQAGHKVFIHGAAGHTANRLYTEHVLEDLGLSSANNWSDVRDQLSASGFSYLSLEHISPRLYSLINMRNLMGLRSPVHSLARLINPLNSPTVLQGIFHPPYAPRHQAVGQQLAYKHLAVIKGEGGEIERNPDNSMTFFSALNGELSEEEWPAMYQKRHLKESEMTVDQMKSIWRGDLSDEYAHGAILGTCALALKALHPTLTQKAAFKKANTLWSSRNVGLV